MTLNAIRSCHELHMLLDLQGIDKLQDLTFPVWLCAPFYESDRVFNELSSRFNELHYLIHDVWAETEEKHKH